MPNAADLTAKGHSIIAEAMAKAKATEQTANKHQAVSTHVESCLRDLWSLLTAAASCAEAVKNTADLLEPPPSANDGAPAPAADT